MLNRFTSRRGIAKPPRRYRKKTKAAVNNESEGLSTIPTAKRSNNKNNSHNEPAHTKQRKRLPTEGIFAFIEKNRRLFLYYTLFLFGVIIGALVFSVSKGILTRDLSLILDTKPITGGLIGGLSQLVSSCFSTVILLLILFVCGLSACGVPVSVVVPVFFGLGVGLSSAFHYSGGVGGIAINAVLIIPHTIIASSAIILACMESVKMSTNLSRHLISKKTNNPGLQREFKAYCLRFLLFVAVGISSGIVEIMFKIIFSKLISV